MEIVSQSSFSDAHEIAALPLIAANLHRVIRPEQSQIWAVMRAKDDEARLYYSLCAVMLGRMGLSGDVYELDDHQWALIDEAIAFYKEAADIIKNGTTCFIKTDTASYNAPSGGQLVLRKYGDQMLYVYHRFADSLSLQEFSEKYPNELKEYSVIRKYGKAECDFSAETGICACKRG